METIYGQSPLIGLLPLLLIGSALIGGAIDWFNTRNPGRHRNLHPAERPIVRDQAVVHPAVMPPTTTPAETTPLR
jgi:hypothetical protein